MQRRRAGLLGHQVAVGVVPGQRPEVGRSGSCPADEALRGATVWHMERIGVRELRQHASRYLARVRLGETLEVTERGRPVARLVPSLRIAGRR